MWTFAVADSIKGNYIMKAAYFKKIVLTAILLLFVASVHAYSYAVGPASVVTPGDWTEDSGTYSVTLTGANTEADLVTDANSDGLFASITMDAANCPGFCQVRADKVIGTYNGDLVFAEIKITHDLDIEQNLIWYRVRTFDPVTFAVTDEISRGFFGPATGLQWNVGDTIMIAIALEGDELIFYSDTHSQIAKLKLLFDVIPNEEPLPWNIKAFTGSNEGDSISVTVNSINAVTVTP